MNKLLLIAICIILLLPVLNAQTNPVTCRTTINVVLETEKIQLEEIVVTALGMKREKSTLGYSVMEVNEAEVQAIKELDVINSLAGRAAFVNITQGGCFESNTLYQKL